MVGLQYDLLLNPLGAVRLTFEKAVASSTDPSTFDGRDWGAASLFREFLFDDGHLSQVPLLDAANIRCIQGRTLVRFRGMIQDMPGNELYVGAYKDGAIWRTNKYSELAQFPMDSSSDTRIWERRLLHCVPVPGQRSWTQPSSYTLPSQYKKFTSPQREKRQRTEDIMEDDMDTGGPDHDFQESPCVKKTREAGPSSDPCEPASAAIPSRSTGFGFDGKTLQCLVKIYDSPEADFKMNEVFEFVGVLCFDAEDALEENGSAVIGETLHEDDLAHIPASKFPRLHCIVHRKLGVHDFLSGAQLFEPKPDVVKEIRNSLLEYLTAVLGNDGMAAQYMLLHLLSGVHTRVDSLAVGKLSLNLTGFNKEVVSVFGNRLNLVVENLLPFTHFIPLTVDYLNTASLAPRKDYETNRLVSGVLQLAEGSHMIIDETQLQTGTLSSVGVENVRLLKNLMELQKVEYDFKYYKMEMSADVQLLVISDGKSNILPADVVLPLHPSSVGSYETVNQDALGAWRWYLACLRSVEHSIEAEMQKVVEEDLVASRQADRNLGSQDFSRWLTMGRLMAASFGETSLSLEHWRMVKELEGLRSERLKIKSSAT